MLKIHLIGGLLCVALSFATAQSRTIGDLSWSTSGGTLIISGIGAIPDYDMGKYPWDYLKNSFQKVVIENGVSHIGNNAFHWCNNVESITIPNSVKSIGKGAFFSCHRLESIHSQFGNNHRRQHF